ncbi:MAG TPA: hypothetical protein VJ873_08195, partial [bacterium]|nr:hypothetical protein [bacterium]
MPNNSTFTYTLNVSNFGTGSAQNDLSVVDQLPAGIILQSVPSSDFPGLNISPALPVTGPAPVTFQTFSIPDNFSGNINLQVAVSVNFANGVVQNLVNSATLYQQQTPVASSNTLGQACAGTVLTFHPHKGVGTTGNDMCFCGPDCGTVVGDTGALGTWNGSTVTDVNSPTTEDL